MAKTKLEREYQAGLIERLRIRFPGCFILKNDSGYLQGVPDLLILHGGRWGILEVKKQKPRGPDDYEPNQEWYLELLNNMWFASVIYPDNEAEVLDALQQALSAG